MTTPQAQSRPPQAPTPVTPAGAAGDERTPTLVPLMHEPWQMEVVRRLAGPSARVGLWEWHERSGVRVWRIGSDSANYEFQWLCGPSVSARGAVLSVIEDWETSPVGHQARMELDRARRAAESRPSAPRPERRVLPVGEGLADSRTGEPALDFLRRDPWIAEAYMVELWSAVELNYAVAMTLAMPVRMMLPDDEELALGYTETEPAACQTLASLRAETWLRKLRTRLEDGRS